MDSTRDVGFEYAISLLYSDKYFRFIYALLSISFDRKDRRGNLYQQLVSFVIYHPLSYERNLFNKCSDVSLEIQRSRNVTPDFSSLNEHSICVCSDYLSMFFRFDGFVLIKIDSRQGSSIDDCEVFEFRFSEIIYFINFISFILEEGVGTVNSDVLNCENAIKIFNDLMTLCNVNDSSCYFQRRLVVTPRSLLLSTPLLLSLGVPFTIDCLFAHLSRLTIEGCSSIRTLITGHDVQELSYIRVMGFGVSQKYFLNSCDRFQVYLELYQRLFSLNECAEIQLMIALGEKNVITRDQRSTLGRKILSLPLEILEKVLNDTTSIVNARCNCANLFCRNSTHNNRCKKMRGVIHSKRNFVFPLMCETVVNSESHHYRKWKLVLTTSDLDGGLRAIGYGIGDDYESYPIRELEASFDMYNSCHLQLANTMHFASCESDSPTNTKFAESESSDDDISNWFHKNNETWEVNSCRSEGLIECSEAKAFIPRIRNQLDHFVVLD